MAFAQPPTPASLLARHRILSPSAAIKVSPLCLGAMNFGDAWKEFMGECTKETAFSMLDYFHSQGGNFIDTANNYQAEQSETWLGEWLTTRKCRDEMVIATKFTANFHAHTGYQAIQSNFGGNNAKSLHVSLAASLRKLQTDYIDILYLHWWDFSASVEEIMHSLNALVLAGKVLYLGVSDTPAWIVAKANQYARDHGLRPFVIYQGKWNAALRDFERDIIPMCAAEGMALAPWGALGGGMFKSEAQRAATDGRNFGAPNKNEFAISAALEKIAAAKGTAITSVALAYVMHKAPYVFLICGGRKVEHLKGNIEALGLELSPEEIAAIEGAGEWDAGFPLSFLRSMGASGEPARGPADVAMSRENGHFDYVEGTQPIKPQKL